MRRGTLWFTLVILLLAAFATYVDVNPGNRGLNIFGLSSDLKLKEGLDLQGGIQFLYQASCPQNQPKCDIGGNIQATINNIQNRINGGLGVSESVVTYQQDPSSGNYYISVQLPGVKDAAQATSLIGTTGSLAFINTQGNPLSVGTTVDPTQYAGNLTPFTGKDLDPTSINVSFDATGKPQIDFQMQGSAKAAFASYTSKNIGQYLTITLDNVVIESAVIQSQITGQGEISGGSMTLANAQQIANLLKYGSLPLTLALVSQEQIDATLGAQAIQYSLRAAIIGLSLVVLFMLIYYRLPGFLATIALVLYALTTLMIIKLLGAVLTLAGIAGLILSVGMAVDANILIFERIKEELRGGRTLASAVDFGWKRAWPSIRDSNASTIITCLILAYVGNNFGATIIVGFATNLLIGVLVSLFTAVVVTRTLLNIVLTLSRGSIPPWLIGLPSDTIATPTYRRRSVAQPTPKPALAGAGATPTDDDAAEGEEEE